WGDTAKYEVGDYLNTLVQADLLTAHGEWYSQHRLLNAYAQALLIQNGELDEVQLTHFKHYSMQCIKVNDLNIAKTYPLISAHFVNIRAALDWGFRNRPDATILLLIALTSYMNIRQTPTVGLTLYAHGVQIARQIPDRLAEAACLQSLGD